jgi:hypothetical protein
VGIAHQSLPVGLVVQRRRGDALKMVKSLGLLGTHSLAPSSLVVD